MAGTTFRRGRTEVSVDADLGSGQQRLVALSDGMPSDMSDAAAAPVDGEKVALVLDPRGCARLPV